MLQCIKPKCQEFPHTAKRRSVNYQMAFVLEHQAFQQGAQAPNQELFFTELVFNS